LSQALALRVCAFADKMVSAHPDFHLVATANTFGTGDQRYVGRQTLNAATLDRFTMIEVPLDPKLERRLAHAHAPSKAQEVKRLLKEVQRLRGIAEPKHLPLVSDPSRPAAGPTQPLRDPRPTRPAHRTRAARSSRTAPTLVNLATPLPRPRTMAPPPETTTTRTCGITHYEA
jgi:cobaltochelatase CobS